MTAGECEEHAIVNRDGVHEDRRSCGARNSDSRGAAAERRTRGLRFAGRRVARLKRDARRLRCAGFRADASVANKNLPEAAIGRRARRCPRSGFCRSRRTSLRRTVARRHRQKRNKSSRRADRRQNAFRPNKLPVRIRRNKLRRRRALRLRPRTRIAQIDLPPIRRSRSRSRCRPRRQSRRCARKIRRRRAERDISPVTTHRRRPAISIAHSSIRRRGQQRRVRLAPRLSPFARIAHKNL